MTTVLAHDGDLQVRFRAQCGTRRGDCAEAEVGGAGRRSAGRRVYSRGESLEAVIGEAAGGGGPTLAVAESATGGGSAERITSVAGSSAYFTRRLRGVFKANEDRFAGRARGITRGIRRGEQGDGAGDGGGRATAAARTWAISITGNAGPATMGPRLRWERSISESRTRRRPCTNNGDPSRVAR